MRFFKKLLCLNLLLITGAIYKFMRIKIPFWHWLYARIERNEKYTFIEGCYIKFLFADACNKGFSEGICNVYESYRPGISENELPSKDLINVFNASIEQKNQELANRIMRIVECIPNHFPKDFKLKYIETYKNTFND